MAIAVAPPDFPAGIPVSRETFENWAQMIEVRDVWTCVPRTEDDVVRVCNWAAGAGYAVRPRGIMHTWSPLTVTEGMPIENLMLVDTTVNLTGITVTAADGRPAQVVVQTGATMDALMRALEAAPGGQGAAPGFGFAHIPAPGNITVGGALAINAHGTAVPTPGDDFDVPYGSLSNQILSFTAVVSGPGSKTYAAQTFTRGQGDDRAFLTHCGRAFLLNVTLQITDNYNLRCQSFMNIPSTTLFAQPQPGPAGAPPAGSVGDYLDKAGRVEVIWFPALPLFGSQPPTSYPWLKVWTVTPEQPAGSTAVTEPYNYPFSDNLPSFVTDLLRQILGGSAWVTPYFCQTFAAITSAGLNGELGSPNLTDLWGPSKNTLLYIKDSTLRVTANGYAVLMKKAQVQQAVADFAEQFEAMILAYQKKHLWPINSPLEIRVTGLDDPAKIVTPSGAAAASPVISSLSVDPVTVGSGWDVACWFDVLTVIPDGDPQKAYQFYVELEDWFMDHFKDGFRVCPEWSKGWAYSQAGAWTNPRRIDQIRETFTTGRAADDTWAWEAATLAKYDAANLFSNPFLATLFTG